MQKLEANSADKMAALIKAVQAGTSINGITKLFTNLSLAPGVIAPARRAFLRRFVSRLFRARHVFFASLEPGGLHDETFQFPQFERMLDVFSLCDVIIRF